MARAPLPHTSYDWLIDWETGAIREEQIALRAKEATADYVAYCRKEAENAKTDRMRAYYERQIPHADEYEASMVKALMGKATHLAWEFRVYVLGDKADAVTLDAAQIAGLTTDGRIH